MSFPHPKVPAVDKSWLRTISSYATPSLTRSFGQLASSILPYLALWAAMIYSLRVSYWLTLLLAVPAAGFMVRTFIIFHDCGHGSFFESRRLNEIVGFITGVLTFTAHHHWWHDHAIHHATAQDLDRRGVGDVKTITVAEYQAMPWNKRLGYRLFRSPFLLFGLGSTFLFLVLHRFWGPKAGRREKASVIWTNLALLVIIVVMSLLIGFKAYLLIQLPILVIGTSAGVWLFYVQHNFEGVYWSRHEQWDFTAAGLRGSSFYALPKVLQWFTGNIGFHHVHHLNPRIPNYNLERCHKDVAIFRQVRPLTLLGSLKSLRFRLWDEERGCLVGFSVLRLQKQAQSNR